MARLTRKQIKEGLDQTPMGALLGVNPTTTKLTAKEKEFARLVALGETKAQSYREAYKSKGNKNTHAREGHRVASRPNVSTMIATFADAKTFAESHTAEQLRAFVIQQLTQHASDPDIPPAQRIKALELIGKHHGVDSFITRSEVIHTKSSGDIRARIMDKLKLIGASSTQEADITQDNTQDADSLMAELSTPTPSEIDQAIDQGGGRTHIEPGDVASDTHIIPHNQSPDTHNQTPSETIESGECQLVDANWIDTSLSSLSTQSALPDVADAGWEGEILTCNVSGEKNNG